MKMEIDEIRESRRIRKWKAGFGEETETSGYVDTGINILIAVVIGALLLAGLYTLFNTTIMPTVTSKVTELFNYQG